MTTQNINKQKEISNMIKTVFLFAALLTITVLLSSCGDNYDVVQQIGVPGPQGEQGNPGQDGQNGQDGIGCSIVSVSPSLEVPNGGALVMCSSGPVLLLNGEAGPQGEPGPVSPYQISAIIDPCGNAPGIFDEVILRIGNQLLASFSDKANGQNTRLSLLVPGSYVTTDGSDCHFSVNNLMEIQ